jgi:hypothetical protein
MEWKTDGDSRMKEWKGRGKGGGRSAMVMMVMMGSDKEWMWVQRRFSMLLQHGINSVRANQTVTQ